MSGPQWAVVPQNQRPERTATKRSVTLTLAVVAVATVPCPSAAVAAKPRIVALTFDDGPSGYTGKVLRILRQHRVPATFFVVGQETEGRVKLLRRMRHGGHEIGNHTWSHPYLTALSNRQVRNQLRRTNRRIRQETNVRPHVFRPPYDAVNGRIRRIARNMDMRTVLWDVDPREWEQPGCSAISARVNSGVDRQSIVLMHDGGGNRSQTVCALSTVIRSLKRRKYRFVTATDFYRQSKGRPTREPPSSGPESST